MLVFKCPSTLLLAYIVGAPVSEAYAPSKCAADNENAVPVSVNPLPAVYVVSLSVDVTQS